MRLSSTNSEILSLITGWPKFSFGGKSGAVYSFGLLSATAEKQIETFGSLTVSAESELYFRLVAESQTVESL